jgi:hypothetical protein
MPEIRLLQLEDRPLIDQYLSRYPAQVSELTFTNLFVWRHSRPVFFAETKGTLVFLVDAKDTDGAYKVIFGPVIGRASPLDVVDALDQTIVGFVRIPEDTAKDLKKGGLHVEPDRDHADYVYRVENLSELAGRRFHKKRNLIKQCLQKYHCSYEPVTSERIPECLDMQGRWCAARQCGHDPGLCTEYVAVVECLSHWDDLPLLGGAIRIDGKLQAFALGEMLGPDTAVCHFEKAMPGYRGLGQLINQWFARYALDGVTFENREQDLGVPGLRQAKKSYFPDHLVHKFRAWFPDVDPALVAPVEPHECGKHEKDEDNGHGSLSQNSGGVAI